ncbi:MAG: translation initiation factor IF-3 [Eubacteriales bacterium]
MINTKFWRCFNIATKSLAINEAIRAREIRVIDDDGSQLGIMSTSQAQNRAYDKGLDLVEISPTAAPPVCRIMDYGKFKFEKEKSEKEARKKQVIVETKEITLSCRIDTHDFDTKLRHALQFLGEGNKVKVGVRFKGREMAHLDIGRQIIEKFEEACKELGTADKRPMMEGRTMTMLLNPIKNKQSIQQSLNKAKTEKTSEAEGEPVEKSE